MDNCMDYQKLAQTVTPRDRPGDAARPPPDRPGTHPRARPGSGSLTSNIQLERINNNCPGIHIDVPCGPALRNIAA